jgi:hypothetical protein
LDFRKYYRKNVQLTGKYFVKGKDETEEILIEDISKTGIKFATLKPHNFFRGDLVELKITLDTPMKMEVRTRVKILWIIDRTVGAQFVDPKLLEKDLGLYLIK